MFVIHFLIILPFVIGSISVKDYTKQNKEKYLKWCTTNEQEKIKCQKWASAIEEVNKHTGSNINPIFKFKLKCEINLDKEKCMNMIANSKADLVTLDPGQVIMAGRYHSLVPIMSERYGHQTEPGYYSVAVVKKSSFINDLSDLKNKHACFPGTGQMAGWAIPLSVLINQNILVLEDCNNIVKSASKFFNVSCAPNAFISIHNPTGDNPRSICSLCKKKCTGSDEYANFDGAIKCLNHLGDIAFVKHNTIDLMKWNHEKNMKEYINPNNFELLCKEGGRAPLHNYRTCNWGYVPAHAVVISSSVSFEERTEIQTFLKNSSLIFSRRASFPKNYNMPEFELFGPFMLEDDNLKLNILFSEDTTSLEPIELKKQTFAGYLKNYQHIFDDLHVCSVSTARLCIISKHEKIKCEKMAISFRAQQLMPQLICTLRKSSEECMQAIRDGIDDLTILEAGDIYKAGRYYNLVPIIAEKYDLNDTSYYVVAVSKQIDRETDLFFLKGKSSCHTGYGTGAGWVIPMSFLFINNRIRPFGCNSLKAASQFFQRSCIPGALSSDHAINAWGLSNLCALCQTGPSQCFRDSSEPYFGHSGALRCLTEGGGEVAFMKHTTIFENTGGNNQEMWAREMQSSNYELLCRDGTRKKSEEYEKCNIGRVASNAIVANGMIPKNITESYIQLFMMAQNFYGSIYSEDYTFKMFISEGTSHDLIFSDSTTQLVRLSEKQRNYKTYLGQEFINSVKLVECSSSRTNNANILFIPFFLYLTFDHLK